MKNKVISSIALLLLTLSSIGQTYQYILYPDKDAVIKYQDGTSEENTNYGSSESFIAEMDDSFDDNLTVRSLMDFDLSSIPSGANVANAFLYLDGINHNTSNDDSRFTIISSDWDETTVTWSSAPSTGSEYAILDASGDPGEDYVVDITDIIVEMLSYPSSYYGIEFKLQDENTATRMEFASSDADPQNAVLPRLVINLVTPTLTPTLDESLSKLYTTSNDGSIQIDVTGGAPPYNYSWSPGSYTTQDISSLTPGTYTLTLTDLVSNQKTLVVEIFDDASLNWKHERNYDFDGNLTAESKQYLDELGRPTQSMTKDIELGKVLAAQTIYDAHGRQAVQTLPAPIGAQLAFKEGFIQNASGNDYSYDDFDTPSTRNFPVAVKNTVSNTLGHHYSDNGEEEYVATTSYPYYRTAYVHDPTGRYSHTTLAGDEYRMGKGKENRMYYFTTYDELVPVFGTNKSYKVKQDNTDKMTYIPIDIGPVYALKKTISVNPDQLKIVTYSDIEGKVIARAVVGSSSSSTSFSVSSRSSFSSNDFATDIHIPESTDDSLRLLLPDYISSYTAEVPNWSTATNSDVDYELYDVYGDHELIMGTDYTLNTSTRYVSFIGDYATGDKFLRITANLDEGFSGTTIANGGELPVYNTYSYRLNYENWTVNYYDLAGRLRMSVSPEGFVMGGSHTMFSTYDYDPRGNLIASKDPDYGFTEMVYDFEDRLRFSQNEEQESNDAFNYINYDEIGRSVESGEYRSAQGDYTMFFQNYYESHSIAGTDTSALEVLNESDGLNNNNCYERHFSSYYTLDNADEINSTSSSYTYKANYTSFYRPFDLSKSWNDNQTIWYGYNKRGQLTYYVQQITESDFVAKTSSIDERIKTVDFTYDSDNGNMLSKEYQKYVSTEKLKYNYTYNDNGQLIAAVAEDNSNDNLARVDYEYYLNGSVKRKVLGSDLQGVDYVYTINGRLKSINHPSLNESIEPGNDGYDTGENMLVDRDLFGFTIDYYNNDYARTGSNIESSPSTSNSYYSGLKRAKRWRIRGENEINSTTSLYTETDNTKELMFDHTYDRLGRLGTAIFGVYDNNANTFTDQEDYAVWGNTESSVKKKINYDLNGNIEKLQRNGYDLGSSNYSRDDLDYTYNSTKKNRLDSFEDNVVGSAYTDDLETTGADNLYYNDIGQLTSSEAESISSISYTSSGKVKEVEFTNSDKIYYSYDANDNKIKSKYYTNSTAKSSYSWFVRSADGSVLSVYECNEANPSCIPSVAQQPLVVGETIGINHRGTVLYSLTDDIGNERVAFKKKSSTEIYISDFSSTTDGWSSFSGSTISSSSSKLKVEDTQAGTGAYKAVSLTNGIEYEVSLNVDLGTASELTMIVTTCSSCTTSYSTPITIDENGIYKMAFTPTQTGNSYVIIYEDDGVTDYEFEVDLVKVELRDRLSIENFNDYYPFGEIMPGRSLQSSNVSILGFKGEENTRASNWVDFKLRMYNPGLGRWITPDPYHQDASPYAAMGNNPISNIDPDGGWYYDPNYNSIYKRAERVKRAKERLYNQGYDEYGNFHYTNDNGDWRSSSKYKQDYELVHGLKMAWTMSETSQSGYYSQSDYDPGKLGSTNHYYRDQYSRGHWAVDGRWNGQNKASLYNNFVYEPPSEYSMSVDVGRYEGYGSSGFSIGGDPGTFNVEQTVPVFISHPMVRKKEHKSESSNGELNAYTNYSLEDQTIASLGLKYGEDWSGGMSGGGLPENEGDRNLSNKQKLEPKIEAISVGFYVAYPSFAAISGGFGFEVSFAWSSSEMALLVTRRNSVESFCANVGFSYSVYLADKNVNLQMADLRGNGTLFNYDMGVGYSIGRDYHPNIHGYPKYIQHSIGGAKIGYGEWRTNTQVPFIWK